MKPEQFFQSLWQAYLQVTPQAQKIKALFESKNEAVVNDHVALRTLSNCAIDLEQLQPLIESMGYEVQGDYKFEQKKLVARSFVHPDTRIPKIFISELQRHELSEPSQVILQSMVNQISQEAAKDCSILFSGIPWSPIDFEHYEILVAESEYAGWLSYMGLCANHFTVSLNHLNVHNDMDSAIELLIDSGYELNSVGGIVKGEPKDLLVQSSTLADRIPVTFASGITKELPSCFYEFAQRFENKDSQLFQGFITDNADKIFQSTDVTAPIIVAA